MRKNVVSVVAIILSIVALSAAWPRKNMEVSSLTLKDRAGHVYAVIDANHRQFTLYNPNGKEAVDIQVAEEGANIIVLGADGFERIRLSTWTSDGSYIQILRDGWQNDAAHAPIEVVHISKDGVKVERIQTNNIKIVKNPFADDENR